MVIRTTDKKAPSLGTLIEAINPDNLHGEVPSGKAVGKEIVLTAAR